MGSDSRRVYAHVPWPRAAPLAPGPIRLGFTATTAGPFERARPDCALTLKEVALADSYTPLRIGDIDVLVCWLVLDGPGLTLGPAIASYERVLAMADDHPLAGEESVSVEVLADYAVPNWEFKGTAARVREAMVPSRRAGIQQAPIRRAGPGLRRLNAARPKAASGDRYPD